MIFGIGTDVCDLRRLAATLERRGDRFAERVLGPEELKVFLDRRSKVDARGVTYLGTRFSAKEALSKAIGLGMTHPMTWHACEVLNDAGGQPRLQLHGELAEWFAARKLRAHISLSDETDYAVAFAVIESESP